MKSTNNKTTASENSQTNAKAQDKQNSSEQLMQYHQVKDTPFTIIKHEKGNTVMIGKYRLSEDYETAEEAMKDAKRMDWDRIMQVIGVMLEEYKNEKSKK